MTTEKEGRPARRKGGVARAEREALGPGSRKEGSGQDRGMTIVDPWGALLEQLLEPPAEDGAVDGGIAQGGRLAPRAQPEQGSSTKQNKGREG